MHSTTGRDSHARIAETNVRIGTTWKVTLIGSSWPVPALTTQTWSSSTWWAIAVTMGAKYDRGENTYYQRSNFFSSDSFLNLSISSLDCLLNSSIAAASAPFGPRGGST
jgi:hypothetical protein